MTSHPNKVVPLELIKSGESKVQSSVDDQQSKFFRERYCYGCGQNNHFIKSCPLKKSTSPSLRTSASCIIAGDIKPNNNSEEQQEKKPQ